VKKVFDWDSKIQMLLPKLDGSIKDFLEKSKGKHSNDSIIFILHALLKGLECLHQKNIIHRDIKTENVLFSNDGSIKLSDLGICAQLTQQVPTRKTVIGTAVASAPEVIDKAV
jgi:serine/threonine-protein kinase CLA4